MPACRLSETAHLASEGYWFPLQRYEIRCDRNGVAIRTLALLGLIEAERVQTFRYIAQKLTAYMEAEGGPDNIVNEPANLHMPIGHLIEYWLHRGEGPDLRNYLRKIRMPGATAYAKETAGMFRTARATAFSQ